MDLLMLQRYTLLSKIWIAYIQTEHYNDIIQSINQGNENKQEK